MLKDRKISGREPSGSGEKEELFFRIFVYASMAPKGELHLTKYSPDEDPSRPLPLQAKIGRIVQALAHSSLAKSGGDPVAKTPELEVSEDSVGAAIRAWQERSRYLPDELLSDPVWGMLLELLHSEIGHRPVTVSRLCEASEVPTSSAMRWLKALEEHELVVRRADPRDSEQMGVELTPRASNALRRYFRDVVQRQ